LIVTGRLCWIADEAKALQAAKALAADLGIPGQIVFLGPYAQAQGPSILRQAHLLLHTKYNDPCPTIVLEAMACGLPVVYSHSGGVSELVGEEGGIGVPARLDWEHDEPPDPEIMAQAVLMVAARREAFAQAARQRAIGRFDLKFWRERHRLVFEKILNS
jgi:glycosyltransferase involved in cell wall biosynthesis